MASDLNQNMNMASQQKFDVDLLRPSIPNHWIQIYKDRLIPTNSRQINKSPEMDEQQKGLIKKTRQQEYLEFPNNFLRNQDNGISTLNTDYLPINKDLNETNHVLEMRNKQNSETAVDDSELSMMYKHSMMFEQRRKRVLVASDSICPTNIIASMEHVPSQNFMIDDCTHIPPKDDACSESVQSQGVLNVDTMFHAFRNSINPSFIGNYGIGRSVDSNVTNFTSPSISEGTLANEYPKREQNDTLFYLNNREERQICSMEIEERKLKLAEKANILRTNYSNRNAVSNLAPNFLSSLDTDGPQADLHVDPKSKNPFKNIGPRRFISDKEKSLLLRHEGQKHYQGEYCKKTLSSEPQKERHSRSHTEKIPFTCDICNKSFSRKHVLLAHKRSHTDEKRFSCDSCPKRFSYRGNLRRHRLIHENPSMKTRAHEKPFQCKDCGKAFTHKNTLKLHAYVHTGKSPFKCGNCDKTFSSKSNLHRHRKNFGH